MSISEKSQLGARTVFKSYFLSCLEELKKINSVEFQLISTEIAYQKEKQNSKNEDYLEIAFLLTKFEDLILESEYQFVTKSFRLKEILDNLKEKFQDYRNSAWQISGNDFKIKGDKDLILELLSFILFYILEDQSALIQSASNHRELKIRFKQPDNFLNYVLAEFQQQVFDDGEDDLEILEKRFSDKKRGRQKFLQLLEETGFSRQKFKLILAMLIAYELKIPITLEKNELRFAF